MEYKYKHEIHCNEVAILPYYIANLNIEYTYKQKMGVYEEFDNICFVDTLEHTSFDGKQLDLFAMSVENTERIKRQNESTISVIIGNPPYNAKQENFNDHNANRAYLEVDKRIKQTYVKNGTAQNQIVLYDMYVRFIRWASDRLKQNGILALITNSSFIDARTFDGFRKVVSQEFSDIYIIDLGGNIRTGDKSGSVFGIQLGTAISFMVKKQLTSKAPCRIFYKKVEQYSAEAKLDFLAKTSFDEIDFEHIHPDKKYNWINQSDNDFDSLLTLIDKDVKAGKGQQAIFELFSSGVKTQRDEWVYDFSKEELENRIKFFIDVYERKRRTSEELGFDIKWDRELKKYLERNISKKFSENSIIKSIYRPFIKKYLYFDKHFNGMTYQWFSIYHKLETNRYISIAGIGASKPFHCLVTNRITCLDCLEKTQCLPLYRYDEEGNRIDNITDWGLKQFQNHYKNSSITKEDIFHYTYAVLHNPEYRQKYELNLKREFSRLPFYDDFYQWVNWGMLLMNLHINYENVTPYPLKRIDVPLEKCRDAKFRVSTKVKLKADKDKGTIILDNLTTLTGVPKEAWEYRLGNRSALEWILDQYKEKKIKDATIAAKFNTYRFSDYKEQVIDLLQRVCYESLKTMEIIQAMS